jgi:hypothetical protein
VLFIDECGEPVPPSAIVGLVAARELARHLGSAIVHNVITSAAAVEIIREHGGTPVRSRVGHSFMKALMAEHDAIFGGEHSGHYYFRDFWRADTGMLAALHVLAALGGQDRSLSQLTADYTRYAASGEINSRVDNVPAKLIEVEAAYTRPGVVTDRLDGLTVNLGDGRWFNVRPSNTEPLLRLNVEAHSHGLQAQRPLPVAARHAADLPGRGDEPAPMLLLSQQRGEARCGVEAWQAQPVHRAVAADQGGRLQVTDQCVILHPHGNSSPGVLPALPWRRRAPDCIVPPEPLLPPRACIAPHVMPLWPGPGVEVQEAGAGGDHAPACSPLTPLSQTA